MKIIIVTIKSCHINNAEKFKLLYNNYKILVPKIVTEKEDLNYNLLKWFNPDYVFFVHWSWYIPKDIYENFNCILFHTADLPFGSGGSPIQNQIVNKIYDSAVTALKVTKQLDSGEIYYKKHICLYGSCDGILIRISDIIFNDMIPYILKNKPKGIKQCECEIEKKIQFQRRTKEDSYLNENQDLSLIDIYDHIRMLDGEGYPKSKIIFGGLVLEFSRASLRSSKDGNYIISDAVIRERNFKNE